MDKDIFYIGLFFALIGIGGQVIRNYYGASLIPSITDFWSFIGYVMIAGGVILLGASFWKPGPMPGFRASVVVGLVLLVLAGATFTGIVSAPIHTSSVTTLAAGHEAFVDIALGASSGPAAPKTYVPDSITVIIGKNNTVEWSNQDTAAHTVTSLSGPTSFNSGILAPGANYVVTFTAPGVYDYHCEIHAWMFGSVTVLSS
jgi:plastocyanin